MMISQYFKLSEFESKDGQIMPLKVKDNVLEVAKNLDVLRQELGTPVIINSGYRSISHNRTIGGVENSFHIKGMAADIRTAKHTPEQIYQTIDRLIKVGRMKQGGLGLYDTFVHYDIQGKHRRWDNRSIKEPLQQGGAFFFSCPCCGGVLEVSTLTRPK